MMPGFRKKSHVITETLTKTSGIQKTQSGSWHMQITIMK